MPFERTSSSVSRHVLASVSVRTLFLVSLAFVSWALALWAFCREQGDAAAFIKLSGFALLCFVGAGCALAFLAGLDLRDLSLAAVSPVLGLVYQCLAYFFAMWLRLPALIWPLAFMPLLAAVLLWAVQGRSDSARSAPARPPESIGARTVVPWPVGGTLACVMVWLAIAVSRISFPNLTNTPQGLRTVARYNDQAHFLANAAILKRMVPPEHSDLAGVISRYHYFGDLAVAMTATATDVELTKTYRFLVPLTICFLFGALCSLSWTLNRDLQAMFWAVVLVLSGGDFSFLSSMALRVAGVASERGNLFDSLLDRHFWGNPSLAWFHNWPTLVATLVALATLTLAFRYRQSGSPGVLFVAAVFTASIFKFKIPFFGPFVVALVIGGLLDWCRGDRPRLLIVALLAVALSAPAAVALIRYPAHPTIQLALFPYLTSSELTQALAARLGRITGFCVLIALIGVQIVGFLGLRLLALVPARRSRTSVPLITVTTLSVLALCIYFFAAEPERYRYLRNTVRVADLGLILLSIPAAEGIIHVLAGNRLRTLRTLSVVLPALLVGVGAVGFLWTYPDVNTKFLSPESVQKYRFIRVHGLPDSRIISLREEKFAPALSEHSFFVHPWLMHSYTQRLPELHRRTAQLALITVWDDATLDTYLRENRIEFIITPAAFSVPPQWRAVLMPTIEDHDGTLWQSLWARERTSETIR